MIKARTLLPPLLPPKVETERETGGGGRLAGSVAKLECCSTLDCELQPLQPALEIQLLRPLSQAGVEVERFERAHATPKAVCDAAWHRPPHLPSSRPSSACSYNSIFHLRKCGHSFSRLVTIQPSLALVSDSSSKTFVATFLWLLYNCGSVKRWSRRTAL